MKWLELSIKAPPEFVEPLSQIFHRYGHGGVALEQQGGFNPDEGETPSPTDWITLKTYLPLNATLEERRNHIDLGVRLVAHVSPISPLHERVMDEEEWQNGWKRHFTVLHVGKRIVIVPPWQSYKPRPSEITITLDPGMAFGTGHHPTTRRCLEQLESLVEPGMDILDVGCGSGILSIAAAKLGAKSVLSLEIDSVAVGVAKRNILENESKYSIRVIQGSLPNPVVRESGYHVAVANISAMVISQMAPDLVNAIRPKGKLIASGLLDDNKARVELALATAGAVLEQSIEDGDWVTLVTSIP